MPSIAPSAAAAPGQKGDVLRLGRALSLLTKDVGTRTTAADSGSRRSPSSIASASSSATSSRICACRRIRSRSRDRAPPQRRPAGWRSPRGWSRDLLPVIPSVIAPHPSLPAAGGMPASRRPCLPRSDAGVVCGSMITSTTNPVSSEWPITRIAPACSWDRSRVIRRIGGRLQRPGSQMPTHRHSVRSTADMFGVLSATTTNCHTHL